MKFIHHPPGLFKGILPGRQGFSGILHRPDEYVFRSVRKVDKFQQLGIIPGILQQICPDGVRHEGAEALRDNAVSGKEGKPVRVNLFVQFMLAAGYGENHPGVPGRGVVEGIVGCGVAGMEGDDHIHVKGAGKPVDVPQLKPEMVITVFVSGGLAFSDNILF